jgi:hypothetical protein
MRELRHNVGNEVEGERVVLRSQARKAIRKRECVNAEDASVCLRGPEDLERVFQ